MIDVRFGEPAWVDTILDRMQSAVRAANIVAADLVFVYEGDVGDLLRTPPHDTFVVLSPDRLPVDAGKVAGGGRAHTVFAGTFLAHVCRRVGSDREFRSARLLQEAGGLSATTKRVVDALQVQALAVAAGGITSTPLIEPMRLVSCDYNPRAVPSGWAHCRLTWSVKFRTAFGT